jgi:hypothetical protein
MAALAFRSIGSHASTATPISGCSPALPAGHAATDLLLMFVEHDNGVVNTPAGWEAGPTATQASTMCTSFWKTDSGAESAPTVTGAAGSNHLLAVILAFSAPSASPINTSAGDNASSATAVSWPAATATEDGTIVVHAVAVGTDSSSTTLCGGYANGGLTNLTERFDQSVIDANGGGLAIVTGELATAGTTGVTTATLATGAGQARLTIVIASAASDEALSANLNDSVTISDAAPTFGVGLRLTETTTPSDAAPTFAQGFGRTFADTATPSDAAPTFDIGKQLADTVTIEDTNQRGVDVRMSVLTTRHNDFVVTITALP